MATTTLTFTDYHFGTNPEVPSSIVGSDPWGDDDVDTYTEAAVSERDGITYGDAAIATPVKPSGMTALNSYSIFAEFTATNIGGTGTDHRAVVEIWDVDSNYLDDFGVWSWLDDGIMHTQIGASGDHSAALENVLLNGGTLKVRRLTNPGVYSPPADYILRTHRLLLTIDYDAASVASGVQRRRIFQRAL